MSLNGLDNNVVVEAHQTALADPGGWFLLKYANRDTVELLSRGNGGVSEAKGAVSRYEEKSPLYGMVQYRRKRVLLKYVPEGTSRLLQVRLSVQFQSILDALPHDTIFSFTDATELVESALGLCTMLQPTNGGSLVSSNSSLRQRRLNEISEDAEVPSTPTRREEISYVLSEPATDMRVFDNSDTSTLPASAVRAKALLAKRKEENQVALRSNTSLSMQPPSTSASILDAQSPIYESSRPLSSLSQLKNSDNSQARATDYSPVTPRAEQRPVTYHHSRHLSENESQSISQWNDQVAAYTLPTPKPKKKLAPRPHVENQTRPKTASFHDDNLSTRPVANLPHSVRVSNRAHSGSTIRPGSQQSSRSVPARFLPTPSLPPPLEFDVMQSLYRRPESRKAGSAISSALTDVPTASPEKLRLMKALQQRKRTQLLAQRAASAQSSFGTNQYDFPLDTRQPEELAPAQPLPSTIKEESTLNSPDPASLHDSSTASPTSVATMSNNPSTRPSSFAGDQESHESQRSASHDTDSSSTPKAMSGKTDDTVKNNTSWHDSAPDLDLNETSQSRDSTEPLKAYRRSDYVQSRDLSTLSGFILPRDEITFKQQDRSTLSWLASDSQLDVVKALAQTADPVPEKTNDKSALEADAIVQPRVEDSSVISDDDDLDEELHKATVHEATPVSVIRPPLTPTMRTLSMERSRATTVSSFSITPKSSKSTPTSEGKNTVPVQRSPSALPQWPPGSDDEPMAVPLSKKTTLGNGISQRIKALEDSSRRDATTPSTPSTHDSTAARATFSNVMKRNSFLSHFQGSSPSMEKSPSKEPWKTSLPGTSAAEKRLTTRPWEPRQGVNADLQKLNTNSEISVAGDANTDQAQSNKSDANLEKQPLSTIPLPALDVLNSAGAEGILTPVSDKKRFSFASYRSGSTTRSAGRWMTSESVASRISLVNNEAKIPKKAPSESSSIREEKRPSRTSRLMKRVSGFGSRFGGKGQQQASGIKHESRPDPIMEQNETLTRTESATESLMQTINIGDVNVQFPESLLWKRRFLRIDDQGYLIFTAPTESQSVRTTVRKFHLGDVQEPCLPDLEREEMAWSVLLDLRDGNCIQCACESKQAQSHVLKMLLDAHSAYHSLYPDSLE